jgi:putative addiction module component (TIGR02574 family)
MSFAQVLDELPALTAKERQILIRRALELDDPPLSEAEAALINSRLEAHHRNPSSSVSLKEMKTRVRGHSAR